MEKAVARAELVNMGEPCTDRSFKDICVHWITADYKDIKHMVDGGPTLVIDQMQSTIRHLYLGNISNSGAKSKNCRSWRSHRSVNIDVQSPREDKSIALETAGGKRTRRPNSSSHLTPSTNRNMTSLSRPQLRRSGVLCVNTTSYDDAGFYTQGEPRPARTAGPAPPLLCRALAPLQSTTTKGGPSDLMRTSSREFHPRGWRLTAV